MANGAVRLSGDSPNPGAELNMTPIHTNAREAALRKLSRVNRWMIAISVALTALFSEVAANAFPGRKTTTGTGSHSSGRPSGSTSALKAPSEAPRSSTTPEASPSQEVPPAQESKAGSSEPSHSQEPAPAQEPAPESTPSPQTTPEKEPESTPAPAPEPAPAPTQESSPPVVSGGS